MLILGCVAAGVIVIIAGAVGFLIWVNEAGDFNGNLKHYRAGSMWHDGRSQAELRRQSRVPTAFDVPHDGQASLTDADASAIASAGSGTSVVGGNRQAAAENASHVEPEPTPPRPLDATSH